MDDVSLAIGELRSDMVASQNQRTELFTQVGGIKDDMSEMKSLIMEHTAHIGTMLDRHDVKIKDFDADISGLKKFKRNMLLGIASVAGTGGITGALLTKLGLQ